MTDSSPTPPYPLPLGTRVYLVNTGSHVTLIGRTGTLVKQDRRAKFEYKVQLDDDYKDLIEGGHLYAKHHEVSRVINPGERIDIALYLRHKYDIDVDDLVYMLEKLMDRPVLVEEAISYARQLGVTNYRKITDQIINFVRMGPTIVSNN